MFIFVSHPQTGALQKLKLFYARETACGGLVSFVVLKSNYFCL